MLCYIILWKMEKEFEAYWKRHETELIRKAPHALKQERTNTGKMNTAGDWLLFIVPIIVMIGIGNLSLFGNEIVNLLVSFVAGLLCFVLAVLIKPYVTGKRNVVDIDKDIKNHFYRIYRDKGVGYLNELLKS